MGALDRNGMRSLMQQDADARSSLELELQSIRSLLSGLCSSGGCVGGLRGVDVIRRGRPPVRMRLPAFHRSPSWSACLAPSLPSSAHCARASRPGKNRSSLTTLTTQSPQGRAEPWPIRWTQCAGHSTGAEAALEHMAIIKSTRHRTEWASNKVEVNTVNPNGPLLSVTILVLSTAWLLLGAVRWDREAPHPPPSIHP